MTEPSLENRILAAARKLFLEPGYHATNTRALASEAGTSESGIFRLFSSKYHVLMAVYNDAWGRVNSKVEARLGKSSSTDPRELAIYVLQEIWKIYKSDPVTASFIIINTGNTDSLVVDRREKAVISEENVRYVERLHQLCEDCVAKRMVSGGLSAGALREGLLGISEGILLGWYLADNTDGAYPQRVSLDEATRVARQLLTPIGEATSTKRWEK